MKIACVALALWAAAGIAAALPDADARYHSLLEAARAGHDPVDWAALRLAYSQTSSFDVFGREEMIARKAIGTELQRGDTDGALKSALALINADFVEPEGHLAAAVAYERLGRGQDAARERATGTGLLQSIHTGDGASAARPFTVIRVSEEYEFLAAMGRRPLKQALVTVAPHVFDVMTTTDAAGGGQRDYWFLIDDVFAAESRAFSPNVSPRQ
jgi:hypothetical protein